MAQKTSPVKSISVRQDPGGKRAMHMKQKEEKYVSIANFHFDVEHFVEFPKHFNRYNCFVLEVHRTDGTSMRVSTFFLF